MAKAKLGIDDLLVLETRTELRDTLAGSRIPLSLPQAQTITARLDSLSPATHKLRLGIVHTYTSQLMDPWLSFESALQGLTLQTYHAPYGVTILEAQAGSGLVGFQPDITLLLLQREELHPNLAKPLVQFDNTEQDTLRAEVAERLAGMISQFRSQKVGQLVLTLLPSLQAPALGVFDSHSERSENAWWSRLKSDISQFLRDSVESALFLDLDDVMLNLGRANFFDQRLWYSSRFPFTSHAAREIARRVVGLGVVLKFPKAKVIVLDADNTLWGGIVGEDGFGGIALGPDYPGNTFIDFQRRILGYKQRGFILALCSKNNPADVEQVLRDHPHQLLREEHFAARRVNWLSKADNLVSLAEELNIGLDSIIFVDDSDHECAAVRQRLPQVEVVQTPARQIDIPACLDQIARLEVLSLTAEDLVKTEMYAQERKRREMKEQVKKGASSPDDYLASLAMKMHVSLNAAAHLSRLSQMTQKTNQFNLTTRRYDEQTIGEFITSADWLVADFALVDVFGHSGIAGLAILRYTSPQNVEMDTLLMSCRVIGRQAEAAFLHCLLRYLARIGVEEVVADFLPTAKNELVKTFLIDQGFEKCADGRYRWNLARTPAQPESAFQIAVTLEI